MALLPSSTTLKCACSLTLNYLVIHPLLHCYDEVKLFCAILKPLRALLYPSVSVNHV